MPRPGSVPARHRRHAAGRWARACRSARPNRRRVFARDDGVGPETLRLIELARARRERGHVAAIRGSELHGHVPQPADADDAYPIGRLGEPGQRREDGDTPAQERPGVGEVQLFRQRDGPGPVRADVTREPAAMTDDRCLRLRAKVMASRHALVAVHAATGDPADADALSDLESLGIRTYSRDSTDDLVAENRGVLRHAPVIVQDGEIGVTQTAVFDGDFNVLGPERSEINGFEHHRLFSRLRDPRLIIHRVSYSETSAGLDGGWLVAALG